jgi:ERCC4-related helicase
MLSGEMEPREYQQKIAKTASSSNTLVVLPTGLGKTMIAVMVAAERMERFPESKVMVLAPTKPLVLQH